MKKMVLVGAILTLGAANVLADCTPDTIVLDAGVALSGQRIEATGGEDWKEIHCSGGRLFKVGAGTVVDPETDIGAWTTDGAVVTYKYDKPGGGTNNFTFELHESGGTYFFCDGLSVKASGTLSPESC
ncbi:MAG: hypothetical protein KBT88_02755 [Gammaproteobacteria bacterium]|nr:hypothetical protein [Gammaproteobacteria bacterium]MBQ0838677.1 hypothetical protein [Gammaproteobacteria bacterium]